MIIYHLNPNYILISDNTYFIVKMIISLINTPSDICTCLKLIGEFISLFTYFFYLEIIELKCCNMNFNTRIHINERSDLESHRRSFNYYDDEDDDIPIINTNSNTTNDINDNDNDNGSIKGSEMVNMKGKDDEQDNYLQIN